ncbi:MAG: UbiX family flavin prenyltransferase [Geminicoccaceae bacterium]|nr:UbiX family flavin prenyltransferase [Geminicoccaceae bacterium]
MDGGGAKRRRVIVAITGASGAVYGVRLLERLRDVPGVETHLVVTKAGGLTLKAECGLAPGSLAPLADHVHSPGNLGAPIASGSFRVHGMIVAPCSIRTASAIATGLTDDLVSRAADVVLKERRRLVVAVRETPLHQGHLETLLKLARLGATVFPAVPGFYHRPATLDDVIDQTVMRLLDQIDIHTEAQPRWGEAGGVPAIGQREGEGEG